MKNNQLLITLFGSTGDLAFRKLYPAFYRLYKNHKISENFALIGTGRSEWDNDKLRETVLDSIKDEIDDQQHAEKFVEHFFYLIHDVNDDDDYTRLKELSDQLDKEYEIGGNRIFYISLAPNLFPVITGNLKEQNVLSEQGYNRLIIEKPFGHDSQSALELQSQLEESFDENQIYRIDHYLGKLMVQNIYSLRFNNPILRDSWNKESIEQIQITLSEEVGVEDRAEYYDKSGVLRDMIQNHALQLLALLTMDAPEEGSHEIISKNKTNIISSIRPYESVDDLKNNVVFGQYDTDNDKSVCAYRDEKGIDNHSSTATYFAAQVQLNHPNWEGVPIYIRSGKRLDKKATDIRIFFKSDKLEDYQNSLFIEIAPNQGYQLTLLQQGHQYEASQEEVNLSYYIDESSIEHLPEDYERLIFECIEGKKYHFTHIDEVLAAWKFIDNIFELSKKLDEPNYPNYLSYTNGPEEAEQLLAKNGHVWSN